MLPWIIGAVVVVVGAMILDNAESERDKAKKDTRKSTMIMLRRQGIALLMHREKTD